MKKEKSTFASNIASRRKAMGLNQNDFARRVGIGVTTLREIETDVSGGRPETRAAIAQALGCTIEDLHSVGASPSEKSLPPDLIEAMQAGMLSAVDRYKRQHNIVAEPQSSYETSPFQDIVDVLKTSPPEMAEAVRAFLGLPVAESYDQRARAPESASKKQSTK